MDGPPHLSPVLKKKKTFKKTRLKEKEHFDTKQAEKIKLQISAANLERGEREREKERERKRDNQKRKHGRRR